MRQKSLVLVTVDCLRADHVGFLGYPQPTSPFLDALARESFVFPSTVVAGTPTYFSFPAIMASRYPLSLGRDVVGITPQEPTLASVLKQAGFTTSAFLAGNAYISARLRYGQGFDTFNDFLSTRSHSSSGQRAQKWPTRLNNKLASICRQQQSTRVGYEELYFRYCQFHDRNRKDTMESLRPYPAADVLVDQARAWLGGLGNEPFFLWLHFMDCHNPYYPPEKALRDMDSQLTVEQARYLNSFWKRSAVSERRLHRHLKDILALYDAGVRWVDTQIARLVDILRQFGRWNNTVFAITADHGEEFLEHNRRYHPTDDLPEELTHVPLLLRIPQAQGIKLPMTPFSHIDLAPTLLEIMGIPSPATFQGTSCWSQICCGQLPSRPALTESLYRCANPIEPGDRLRTRLLAVREGPYKLVVCFQRKMEKLYNLDDDPREQAPLGADQVPAIRRRLLAVARQHLQRHHHYAGSDLRLRARLSEFIHAAQSAPATQAAG